MASLIPEDFNLDQLPHSERRSLTYLLGGLDESWYLIPTVPVVVEGKDYEIDIVAVSSAAGRVALPLGGAYSASRFALEGLCDALRLEVSSFGVDVCLVEPGLLRDRVHDLRQNTPSGETLFGVESESPYADLARALTQGYRSLMSKAATHAQVAQVIDRALRSKSPKARYAVTAGTAAVMLARRILPDRLVDRRLTKAVEKRSKRAKRAKP